MTLELSFQPEQDYRLKLSAMLFGGCNLLMLICSSNHACTHWLHRLQVGRVMKLRQHCFKSRQEQGGSCQTASDSWSEGCIAIKGQKHIAHETRVLCSVLTMQPSPQLSEAVWQLSAGSCLLCRHCYAQQQVRQARGPSHTLSLGMQCYSQTALSKSCIYQAHHELQHTTAHVAPGYWDWRCFDGLHWSQHLGGSGRWASEGVQGQWAAGVSCS